MLRLSIFLLSMALSLTTALAAPPERPAPGEVIDQVAQYTGLTNDTVSLALKDNAAALGRLLEPAVAAEAAATRTKMELAELAKALELFERHWKGTHWEMLEADRIFHLCIARATHNDRVIRVVENFWQDMFSPIFAILSSRTKLAEKKALTMHDHRTIFSCIERRDAAGAEAAMLSHLVHAEMKLLKSELDAPPLALSPRTLPRRVAQRQSIPIRSASSVRHRTKV